MIYDWAMEKRKNYGEIYGLILPIMLATALIGLVIGAFISLAILQTTDGTACLYSVGISVAIGVILIVAGIVNEGKGRDLILWTLGAGAVIGLVALCLAPSHAWIAAIAILVTGEAFFIFEKAKPEEKDNRFWFTASRKVINNIESASVVLSSYAVYSVSVPVSDWMYANRVAVINIVGYGTLWTLIGILSLLAIYAYIKMNETKYKNIPIKTKKKCGRPRKGKA